MFAVFPSLLFMYLSLVLHNLLTVLIGESSQMENLLLFFHRYLHREFSESWSVPRLAEGFDVSTDVIRRVLKSKFIPTLEQKLKQDQKVLKKIGLARSIPELPGPGLLYSFPSVSLLYLYSEYSIQ